MAIIDWRVRDQIDHEKAATIELGKTFLDATVEMTERFLALESEIRVLRQRIDDLEGKKL